MHYLRDLFNPTHKKGGYVLPHLAVVAILLLSYLAIFGAGFWSGAHYGPSWFRDHNDKFMPLKKPPVIIAPSGVGAGPNSAWAYLASVPSVVNQWNTNSCVEAETAGATGYALNVVTHVRPNGTTYHRHVRPSGLALYHYINGTKNASNGGKGTDPTQAEKAANTHGLILHRYYDYPAAPPVPFRTAPPPEPTEHHPIWLHWLFAVDPGTAIGQRGLDAIDGQLEQHRAVGVAVEAYDGPTGIYGAAATGTYDTAHLTDLLGGHMILIVGTDKTKTINGVTGWYFAQQTYGKQYGLTLGGQHQSNGTGGYFWVSRRLVARYAYEAEVVHLGTHPDVWPSGTRPNTGASAPGAADGGKKPIPAPTGLPKTGTPRSGTSASWYVHGVVLTTGQDVSGLLNAWGDHYHVWPVGLAATLGIESGLNPRAERWAGGLDNSCGISQIIVTNVQFYTGIQGARAECNWEEVPANAIYLMTRIYAEYFAYQHNCVTWPWAYGMYNGGGGFPCAYYFNPSGDIAAHVQVFMGWYNYAQAHWEGGASSPPPPRNTFPLKAWCSARVGKGRTCFPHKNSRGRLTWPASIFVAHPAIGSPVNRGHWYKRPRYGFNKYGYRHAVAFAWPRLHRYKIVMRSRKAGVPAPSPSSCDTQHTGCVNALLKVINTDRAQHGYPPFTLSWTQSHCSKAHSKHMAAEGYISHDQFPADVCIPWQKGAGENVGQYGAPSEWQDLIGINNLMLSEPWTPGCTGSHVCNLRSPGYTTIGIGVYYTSTGTWLTEDFVG